MYFNIYNNDFKSIGAHLELMLTFLIFNRNLKKFEKFQKMLQKTYQLRPSLEGLCETIEAILLLFRLIGEKTLHHC